MPVSPRLFVIAACPATAVRFRESIAVSGPNGLAKPASQSQCACAYAVSHCLANATDRLAPARHPTDSPINP